MLSTQLLCSVSGSRGGALHTASSKRCFGCVVLFLLLALRILLTVPAKHASSHQHSTVIMTGFVLGNHNLLLLLLQLIHANTILYLCKLVWGRTSPLRSSCSSAAYAAPAAPADNRLPPSSTRLDSPGLKTTRHGGRSSNTHHCV